jgi:hypothetical protein
VSDEKFLVVEEFATRDLPRELGFLLQQFARRFSRRQFVGLEADDKTSS